MNLPELKSCPFCGKVPDYDDEDMLYPSGVGWKPFRDIGRAYVNFREVPPEQWCYTLHCVQHHGGCGAEISGDSKIEAIEKWNKRA